MACEPGCDAELGRGDLMQGGIKVQAARRSACMRRLRAPADRIYSEVGLNLAEMPTDRQPGAEQAKRAAEQGHDYETGCGHGGE